MGRAGSELKANAPTSKNTAAMKTYLHSLASAFSVFLLCSQLHAATHAVPATNGPAAPDPVLIPSTLTRQITLTEDGAAATFGLTKLFWKADITQPITIITPDAQTLYCRPAFLVLANRQTGQSLMLGAV